MYLHIWFAIKSSKHDSILDLEKKSSQWQCRTLYCIMYQKNLNLKSNNFDWVALIRRGHGGVSEMTLACYFWSDDLASQAYAPDANLKGGKCGAGARARFSLPTLRFPVKGVMG